MNARPKVRWIARLDDLPPPSRSRGGEERPIVWIARHGDAARWPLPPPEAADLADAALAKREGGAGRVLRRRMLRALVARVLRLHPSAVRFTRDVGGAPGLDGLGAFISTAGCAVEGKAWSAVAFAPYPVGVDLEPGAPADARVRWTLTEAYLKALGSGLAAPPERVRLTRVVDRWSAALPDAPSGHGGPLGLGPVTAAWVVLERGSATGEGGEER